MPYNAPVTHAPVTPAMVLAAGLGTRLRPLSDWIAKALVPVGDRPALAHVFDRIAAGRVGRIVVNAHHHANDVKAFVHAYGKSISVSEEKELLGTAGGVVRAGPLLGPGQVLVWNADVIADVDIPSLLACHARGNAEATLVVQPAPSGRGPVGVDGRGRVVRLRQERFGQEVSGGEFLGISVIGESLRARLPERGCLVGDALLPTLRAGLPLRAFRHESSFFDIGTVERYLDANFGWLDAQGLEYWSGEGARVASEVRLDRSILGPSAQALGSGPISRCVVWPGARVEAPIKGAVVTCNEVVVPSE